MPEVAVARIRVLLRHRHRDAARRGVVDGVFARDDVPLAPRCDDIQLRRERLIRELEANLVVALAGAAVRERVTSGRERDLDLLARDQRTRGGRAEEVVLLVNRAGFENGKEEVARELFLRIDEMEVARASAIRLLRESRGFFGLADVDSHGDDFAAVVFFEPRNDDGRVETAAVGEGHFFVGLHAAFSFVTASTCSSASMNSANAFFGVMYGGRRRMTLSRAVPQTNPFASSSATTGFAGPSSSMPHMNPSPRMSTIDALCDCSASNCVLNHSPIVETRSSRFDSSISSRTASPRRQATGLPPNVVP